MKLTVDASIVIKWFVTEPLCEEARQVLGDRLDRHAPDILLAEFVNIIWKKVRRGDISDPQPYFDELTNLPEIVTLHPGGDLIGRAAQIAMAIDHPVYDCLYLACAEVTASVLITADQRLVNQVQVTERLPNLEVRYIGAPGVARQIESAAKG